MVTLKKGDFCEIVDIHENDVFFEDKKYLIGVKIQITNNPISDDRPRGFVGCMIKFLQPVLEVEDYNEGDLTTFSAVALKKIEPAETP